MKRSFVLHNLKPFSINATYYGSGFIRTTAVRDWTLEVFHRLGRPEEESKFADLRNHFDPKKHGFSVTMTAYYPEAQFYTKKGIISNKTLDMSNCEKGLIDLLFLPKHALQESPSGCQNLQTDDRYITELVSRKRPTKESEPRIEIDIEIVPLT